MTAAHTLYVVIIIVGVAGVCACVHIVHKANQEVESGMREMRDAIENPHTIDSEDQFDINDITEENPWEVNQIARSP